MHDTADATLENDKAPEVATYGATTYGMTYGAEEAGREGREDLHAAILPALDAAAEMLIANLAPIEACLTCEQREFLRSRIHRDLRGFLVGRLASLVEVKR